MGEAILVLNAGSSSLKFTEYLVGSGGVLTVTRRGKAEELFGAGARFQARDAGGAVLADHVWPGGAPGHEGALDHLLDWLGSGPGAGLRLAGVGHRVVHGGARHRHPVRIDAGVVAELERLVPLAPLHQPYNLLPIRLIAERQPGLAQVACFDTAFHADMPEIARTFALPAHLRDEGVRRYGFHGLSYDYIASRLLEIDPVAATGRTVVLHLGNGASICAMQAGRSVATTMGFTALDGLVMGTRCGSIDPGVLLYLMQAHRMDAAALERLLYHESGLLGVSGIASDMRTLLESEAPEARFAVDLFAYRAGREIGSLAAALGGIDAVVFTAGIGENSAGIRARVAAHAQWLGLVLDPDANLAGGPRISAAGSRVSAWVIPTDEELVIGRQTLALVG